MSGARPKSVAEAVEKNTVVWYFGVGSNMLRSKVENRGIDCKISIRSMGPGFVKGHRLAFNMKAIPPIEPAMGGIEPSFPQDECHGALIELDGQEYEKLWLSENAGQKPKNGDAAVGYREILVEVIPYPAHSSVRAATDTAAVVDNSSNSGSCDEGSAQREPVLAVALRATKRRRLASDGEPSSRYLSILIEGARELGLKSEYIETRLLTTYTANPPPLLTWMALKALIVVGLLIKWNMRSTLEMLLDKPLYCVYVPYHLTDTKTPTSDSTPASSATYQTTSVAYKRIRRFASDLGMGLVLLPFTCIGCSLEVGYRLITGKPFPSVFAKMMQKTTTTAATASVEPVSSKPVPSKDQLVIASIVSEQKKEKEEGKDM